LDRLERDEWVERRQDPGDRRAKRVFLTDKVEPLMEKVKLVAQQVRRAALEGISADEQLLLTDLMHRMRANLSAQNADTE
jgi:DNA-binding MarR family transcriptional regulator